jgi:ribosome-associated protein
MAVFEIPEGELTWRFDPSGGPGGQHANRSATRVELRFDVAGSSVFDEATRARILDRLESRLLDGAVVVTVDETRSQARNRDLARQRLDELLEDAAAPPPPPRRPTKPSRGVRRRREQRKRARSETKRLRRKPGPED